MRKIYRQKTEKKIILLPLTKFMLFAAGIIFIAAAAVTAFFEPKSSKDTAGAAAKEEIMDKNEKNFLFIINKKSPLPENYGAAIRKSLVFRGEEKDFYMEEHAAGAMEKMLAAAEKDGIKLIIVSAYRSEEYQRENFEKSVRERISSCGMSYEEAYACTAREVALPRESEHNSGLAADILSDEYQSLDDDGFKNTEAFRWLSQNAHKYGFILRYPENKEEMTGFVFEPWHYRYVGVPYAAQIAEKGVCLEEFLE